MVVPLHIGFEHPDLVWLGVTAFLAFIAGLGVNQYLASTSLTPPSDTEDHSDR